MPTYRVEASFDVTVDRDETIQQFGHDWYASQFGSTPVDSPFVDTPEEAADYFAQNARWALTVLVQQILAQGAESVSGGTGRVSIANLEANNDSPNGPV